MTTTLGAPEAATRRQPAALSALVAVAVVVGWVLYRHYAYPHLLDRLLRRPLITYRPRLVTLVQALLLCLPYAAVLLLWARGLRRGLVSALAAVSTGLYLWGVFEVFSNYVWDSGEVSSSSVHVYEWVVLLVVATLVPLAWGLARRSGRAWMVGLLVGPLAAGLLREMQLHWTWWQAHVVLQQHDWSWMLVAVQYVAPFVLAALACWALDMRSSARGGATAPRQADVALT